MLRVKDKN